MKRGTPDHPKTLDLAARLGIEQWGAVGLLESLWHFVARFARRGDVGRHSDAAVARGIGWRGDPDRLIEALVGAGWLERCRCHRLRVHDWLDHADQTVQRSDEWKKLGPIACYMDASTLLVASSSETSLPLPTPTPTPTPTPLPEPTPAPVALRAPVAIRPATVRNPLLGPGDRPKLEVECLRLVRRLSELTGEDGMDVMARASGYEGATRTKLNPATMTDDRLMNTVRDLRSDVEAEERKRETKQARAGPC